MGGCCCRGDDDDKEEGSEYGKPTPYDPNFKGPIQKRCCTDILMLIIFIAFWVGMVYIAAYGWRNGDPLRLLNPTDSEGRTCGEGEFSNRSKLIFFDITTCIVGVTTFTFVCPTTQVCVSECPDDNYLGAGDSIGTSAIAEKLYCTDGRTVKEVYDQGGSSPALKKAALAFAISELKCPPYYLKSEAVVRRCIPTIVNLNSVIVDKKEGNATLKNGNGTALDKNLVEKSVDGLSTFLNLRRIGEEIYSDIGIVWPYLLGGLFLILLLCLVYIFVMRFVVGIIVWLTIFLVFGLMIFGIGWCYVKYRDLDEEPRTATTLLQTFTYQKKTYLALGIILTIVFLILLLIVIFLRDRIQIAIELIKEASRAIGNMLLTLLFPVVTFILLVLVIVWFVAVALWLQSAGDRIYVFQVNTEYADNQDADNNKVAAYIDVTAKVNGTNCTYMRFTHGDECDPDKFKDCSTLVPPHSADVSVVECVFKEYFQSKTLFRMQIYNLFGLLWTSNYVVALGQCTLAGAFASYYWAFDKSKDIPSFAVTRSFFRAFFWHTGSLAFGALIIAIIQFIRIILAYTQRKLKGYGDNSAAQFFLKCLGCCFWCLEKIFKYINKNAYILVAIYGYHFCKACCRAFNLLFRNILRVFVLNSITAFIFFLSRLLIVGIVGFLSFLVFDSVRKSEDLNYYLIPVILLCLFAYFISWAFFSVYDMAVDTLFLCFLEDLERNDGSAEKPYYMSKGLKKVLNKKNKSPKDKGKSKDDIEEEDL